MQEPEAEDLQWVVKYKNVNPILYPLQFEPYETKIHLQ
jgi:hypothetical protein